ncbi:cyclic nucleotide binding regulatory protein [Cytophaga hutchinsonii ATCC 33406]|uniref:Cyclic nucleotide binding regulatory protein n=2 Tax=Cytophaga hutchinsonii TaxID=985 RepID=A0A6N4SUI0_CYTH3|nr:cyclic nucleotide binding regulatory protein [Cytophaga hutchinsonii ATCC 33406]
MNRCIDKMSAEEQINQFKKFCAAIISFDEEEWQAMEKCLRIKFLSKDDYFLRQGKTCSRMGFVCKGYTRLFFLIDGEEHTKDFCFENTFTGSLASFLVRKPAAFNVVAMEDTYMLTIEYNALMELYKNYMCWNTFGRIVVEQFAIRKENREVTFLLNTPEKRYEEVSDQYPHLLQRAPLKMIASYLNMTPETLSRIRSKKTK